MGRDGVLCLLFIYLFVYLFVCICLFIVFVYSLFTCLFIYLTYIPLLWRGIYTRAIVVLEEAETVKDVYHKPDGRELDIYATTGLCGHILLKYHTHVITDLQLHIKNIIGGGHRVGMGVWHGGGEMGVGGES